MKIKYMSDIHREFDSPLEECIGTIDTFDVLVIAGDLCSAGGIVSAVKRVSTHIYPKKFLYITGNHDFYGSDVDSVTNALIELQNIENFFFLNYLNMECCIGDETIYFIGATGWQTREDYCARNYMKINDFRLIKNHNLTVREYGRDELEFLEDSLSSLKNKKVVVVTHIPPCIEAVDFNSRESKKEGNYLKSYYNDHGYLIERYKPVAWICGHLHDSIDVMFHDTRIVRNAFGYYGEDDRQNNNFSNNAIIEI